MNTCKDRGIQPEAKDQFLMSMSFTAQCIAMGLITYEQGLAMIAGLIHKDPVLEKMTTKKVVQLEKRIQYYATKLTVGLDDYLKKTGDAELEMEIDRELAEENIKKLESQLDLG